jgi:hypothetical protein
MTALEWIAMCEPARFNIVDHYRNLTRHLLARNAMVGTIFSHKDLLGNPAEGIVRNFLQEFLRPRTVAPALADILKETETNDVRRSHGVHTTLSTGMN